jgi:predicted SAM-dependent methyltransferase
MARARGVKRAIERMLGAIYLDGVAREFWRGGRRLLRDARNRFHPPGRALAEEYVARHMVRKLHVGCGNHILEGWLNADQSCAFAHILRLDVLERFPLDDAVFDYVYTEHVIEHIPHARAGFMLSECRRVLKPGGKLRISTPDLAFLLDLRTPDKSALQADYVAWSLREFVPETREAGDAAVINNFMRNWGHQFIYDEIALRAVLAAAGFTAITRRELGGSFDEALRGLENEGRMPPGFLKLESLILEATRPATA